MFSPNHLLIYVKCTHNPLPNTVHFYYLLLVPFATVVTESNSKNRWMGFTLHNRNQSFKQSGECSGFPGKTYRTLNTAFEGRLSSTATRRAVPWLREFVCSMGGLIRNQTHNHSVAFLIKKCIHTLLSHQTTSNQFRNIGRVEHTNTLTGVTCFFFLFLQIWMQLRFLFWHKSWRHVSISSLSYLKTKLMIEQSDLDLNFSDSYV